MTVHKPRKSYLIAFESPQTPGGGIGPVLRRRLDADPEALLITPLHSKANGAPQLTTLAEITKFTVRFGAIDQSMTLFFDEASRTFFIGASGGRVFTGAPTPYHTNNHLEDVLFFAVALATVLPVIEQRHGQRALEVQDWQGAAVALVVKGRTMTITLHNVYDSGPVGPDLLRGFAIDPAGSPGPSGALAATILERALPRTVGAIRTVSRGFAETMVAEPLQAQILAPHLQTHFRERLVVGIDNGPFKDLAPGLAAHLVPANPAGLLGWKMQQRVAALAALRDFQSATEAPFWGDAGALNADVPWFIMAGRNDIRQKGFDVAADACSVHLQDGGAAQFVFCPLVSKEQLGSVDFLRKLAAQYPRNVLVFPGFCPNFGAFRQGADFGLMPSLYEPFGMANEYYLDGVAVVARATGGILQQVVPLVGSAAYSGAVQSRVKAFNSPTGLLFREPDAVSADLDGWRRLNNAEQDPETWHNSVLYRSMVDELARALGDAERLTRAPHLYAAMVIEGALHIQRSFSWERNRAEYDRLGALEVAG